MLGPAGAPPPGVHPPGGPTGAPPPQIGAAVSPQGNPGLAVQAMGKVRTAVKMLQEALPQLPMGGELHVEVLNSVKSLTKHLESGDQNKGMDLMELLNMARAAKEAQPMQALNRAFPSSQNAPPALAGGGAPPMARAA